MAFAKKALSFQLKKKKAEIAHPDADIVSLEEGLWLVRSHAVRITLSPAAGSSFSASKWEVTRSLKSLTTATPHRFEVTASRTEATAVIGFEAAEPAAKLVNAVNGKPVSIGTHRTIAAAAILPTRGAEALAAGADWESVLGSAADDSSSSAWAAKPFGKRADTVVLRGVPAKWLHADREGMATSEKLLDLMRRVGPVHRIEVARSSSHSDEGEAGAEGLMAFMAPPAAPRLSAKAGSGGGGGNAVAVDASLLNADIWVQFSSATGFRRALQLFPGRVLRREGAQAVFPLEVEVDTTGRLTDAAISLRASEARRAAERERQAERDLLAAQGQLSHFREELAKLREEAAASASDSLAEANEAEAIAAGESGGKALLPANAAAAARAAAAAAAAVERATQRINELGAATGADPGSVADGARAAALLGPTKEAVAGAAAAVRNHRSELHIARQSRAEILGQRRDAAARAEAAKWHKTLADRLQMGMKMLPQAGGGGGRGGGRAGSGGGSGGAASGAASLAIKAEREAAEAALRELGRLSKTPGGAAGLADGAVEKAAVAAVESATTRAFLLQSIHKLRQRLHNALTQAAAAGVASNASFDDGEEGADEAEERGGEGGGGSAAVANGTAPPLLALLVRAVLDELADAGEVKEVQYLEGAPFPAGSDGELMQRTDHANASLELLDFAIAALTTLGEATRKLRAAQAALAAAREAAAEDIPAEDQETGEFPTAAECEELISRAVAAVKASAADAAAVAALPAPSIDANSIASFSVTAGDATREAAAAEAAAIRRKEALFSARNRQILEEEAARTAEKAAAAKTTGELERRERCLGNQVRLKRARERLLRCCEARGLVAYSGLLRQQRGPMGEAGKRDDLAVAAADRWRLTDAVAAGEADLDLQDRGGRFLAEGRPPLLPNAAREPFLLYRLRGKVVVPGQEGSSANDADDTEQDAMVVALSPKAAAAGDSFISSDNGRKRRHDEAPAATEAVESSSGSAGEEGRSRKEHRNGGGTPEQSGQDAALDADADEEAVERLRQQAIQSLRRKKQRGK